MAKYIGKFKHNDVYEVSREEYFNRDKTTLIRDHYYIKDDGSLVDDAGMRIGKITINFCGQYQVIEEEPRRYRAWYVEQTYYDGEKVVKEEKKSETCSIKKYSFWEKLQDDIDRILNERFSYEK